MAKCTAVGREGDLEFRQGFEDWYVHCPAHGGLGAAPSSLTTKVAAPGDDTQPRHLAW